MSSVLHQIFKVGENNPTSPAVIVGDSVFSYGSLCHAARKYSEMLKARSIGAGDRVMLVLPNSFEYIVALMGIWSVGGKKKFKLFRNSIPNEIILLPVWMSSKFAKGAKS